jgi:hypothetical protein
VHYRKEKKRVSYKGWSTSLKRRLQDASKARQLKHSITEALDRRDRKREEHIGCPVAAEE